MKVMVNRSKFTPYFNLISSVCAKKSDRVALQNVKMSVISDTLVLTAYDGELACKIALDKTYGIIAEENGEAIVPAELLKKILATSNASDVKFVLDEDNLILTGGGSRYRLPTYIDKDFPDIDNFNEHSYHEVRASNLITVLKHTLFCTNAANPHYALSGVLFNFEHDSLELVATDGRRLAIEKVEAISHGGLLVQDRTILPIKALSLVEKCADNVVSVFISLAETTASFKMDNIVITIVLKEGRFPRWQGIIPSKSGKASATVPCEALLQAVRQASITVSEKTPGVDFAFENNVLTLSSAGADIGSSTVTLNVTYIDSPAMFRVDPSFVIDFLTRIPRTQDFTMYFRDENTPVLVEGEGPYTYVVMPLTK